MIKYIIILFLIISCQNEENSLSRQEITKDYCKLFQMCTYENEKFSNESECEIDQENDYKKSELENDQLCIDAQMNWQSCVSKIEDCETYIKYREFEIFICREELDEFYNYCMVL